MIIYRFVLTVCLGRHGQVLTVVDGAAALWSLNRFIIVFKE